MNDRPDHETDSHPIEPASPEPPRRTSYGTPPDHPLAPRPAAAHAGQDSAPPPLPPNPNQVYPQGHPWAGYPVIQTAPPVVPGQAIPSAGSQPWQQQTPYPGPYPPLQPGAGPYGIPQEPTAQTFWRDSLVDLAAAFAVIIVVSVITAVIGSIIYLIPGAGAEVDFGGFDRETFSPAMMWGVNFLLIATQIPFLVFALRRLKRNRQKGRPAVKLFDGDWRQALIWGLPIGLALQAGGILYGLMVQSVLGNESLPDQLELFEMLRSNAPAMAVLVGIIVFMAPICEELFFRGAVFGSAMVSGHGKTGMLISACLFAFVHLNPPLAPYYAGVAVVLCWLFQRTGTLLTPMAAHFALNASAALVVLLADDRMV